MREDNGYLNKTITYEYDAGGNILSKKLHAYTTGEPGEVLDEVTYQYNNENWKDQLSHCSAYGRFGYITYDAIGNPVEINDARYTWTNGRQLAAVRLANHATDYTYKYNDEGIRTQKTVEGEMTNYYLNGSTILTQITGNERLDFLYDDTESLIGFLQNGTPYYYVRNLQGDIIGILDSEGNKVVSYVYDSWGSLISITGSLAETVGKSNPYRYRGYYYDEELGWYYLNSRYYDPEVGRFVNADGIVGETSHCHNIYIYCRNNPVNRCDPYGCFSINWAENAGLSNPFHNSSKKSSFIGPQLPSNYIKPKAKSKPVLSPTQKKTQLIVAQTIYGEEHGKTVYSDWQQGQRAVSAIIANRQIVKISYLGTDLETICTNGQFDGYFAGKDIYEANACDAVVWDYAMTLAEYVVTGNYESIDPPEGITPNHLYFNATHTYNHNIKQNGGKFSFGPGTEAIDPKGVVSYGGNTFFYY